MSEIQTITEEKVQSQTYAKAKEIIIFNKLECIYSFLFLALGFCFVRFVLWNITGFFTTIFFWLLTISFFIYFKRNQMKLTKSHILHFALLFIFSLVFSITGNNFIKFLVVLFVCALGAYWIYSVGKENPTIQRFFFFDLINSLFTLPFASFGKLRLAISFATGKSKLGNTIKLILIGLIVTIPVTLLIVTLLINADSGVEKILNMLFGNFFSNAVIWIIQFGFGVPVACYFFGMLYSSTHKVKQELTSDEIYKEKLSRSQMIPNIILYTALTPILLLYIIFFISQVQYFMSAFQGILPQSYSYAAYARKGFFELFAISVINLLLLLVMSFLSKETGNTKPILLKIYASTLSIFTILILSTAFSKMILYIENYGLTRLRVYTSWFMVLLAILFIFIIIKQFRFSFHLAKYFVTTFVLLFAILCFSKVDALIAQYNISMFQNGQLNTLDVEALSTLSDDGVMVILNHNIDIKDYLDDTLDRYERNPYRTYNLSSWQVKHILENE